MIENYSLKEIQVEELYDKLKNILKYVFKCGLTSLEKKIGYYELCGIDFLITEDLKPVLLEINTNPALFVGKINFFKIFI